MLDRDQTIEVIDLVAGRPDLVLALCDTLLAFASTCEYAVDSHGHTTKSGEYLNLFVIRDDEEKVRLVVTCHGDVFDPTDWVQEVAEAHDAKDGAYDISQSERDLYTELTATSDDSEDKELE